MNERPSSSWERTWLYAAAIVLLSVLVGLWNARTTELPPLLDDPHIGSTVTGEADERFEQIEAALAQAGCPGWMVLASEGPKALEDPNVQPTGAQLVFNQPPANPQFSKPLLVANRFANNTPSSVISQPSAKGDPNDLLDGAPDLLWNNGDDEPASAGGDNEEGSETEPKEDPESEQPVALPELPNPLPEVERPKVQKPTVEQPVIKKPITRDDSITPTPEFTFPELNPLPPTGTEALPTPAPTQIPTTSPFTPVPMPSNLAPHSLPASPATSAGPQTKQKTYCEFVAESLYPSAFECAKCHQKLFDEWAVSSHAYAAISPMFHKFEQKINDLSQGTVGYFCYRCHSPVGTTLGVSRAAPIWEVPQVAREGVTCIACHRVNQRYGKVNGERRIEPGDTFAPVYGPIGGSGVAEVIARQNEFKVKTSPDQQGPGQDIHVAGVYFDQLSKPEFCVSCHQVAVQPGIKLEVVWEQYRASPACKKGVSCQDCHMGRIPGVASGYEFGPAAVVNDKPVNENRKHANHIFFGPGYSIAHPGIFPHNKDSLRWSVQDWLLFDHRRGWGTEEFEELVEDGKIQIIFPPVWQEADDRYDAREIIDANLKRLESKRITRQMVMENGSHVDGPFFDTPPARGQELKLHYVVTNTNDGHNMPSGSLGAQPQLWINVSLIGPRGQRLWESGYLDRWGDLADIHSEDVRNKRIPFDWQLFNLQTMFLITGAKGTDREFYLPVNFDFDQLPYLRPGAQPVSVLNHPPFIRMEGRSLAPLGSRKAPYKIPGELLQEPGGYRLSFRMRMRTEPMYFMRFCESTPEMMRSMNEWMLDFHQFSYEFEVR
jgi:hypothetical protein